MKMLKSKKKNELFELFLRNINKVYFDLVSVSNNTNSEKYKVINIFIPTEIINKSVQIKDKKSFLYSISFTRNKVTIGKQVNHSKISISKNDIVSLDDFKFVAKILDIARKYLLQQVNEQATKFRVYFLLNDRGNVEMFNTPLKTV